MKLCSLQQRFIALQARPGSQQLDLEFKVHNGRPIVTGLVANYHALQQVIREFKNDDVKYHQVYVRSQQAFFDCEPKNSIPHTEHEAA